MFDMVLLVEIISNLDITYLDNTLTNPDVTAFVILYVHKK